MTTARGNIKQVFFLLAVAGLAGCNQGQVAIAPPEPPEVLVAYPKTDYVTDYEDLTGRTDSVETVEIRARVTGYLEQVLFDDGKPVRGGAVLFMIDPRPTEAALAQADANLAQSEAHMKRLESDFQRYAVLVRSKFASQEEYDKIAGDLAEARAAVKAARAARKIAEINFEFTKVRAPYRKYLGRKITPVGVARAVGNPAAVLALLSDEVSPYWIASRRMVDPGNLVKADETLLTTLVAVDPMYVYFDVDERTLLGLLRMIKEGKIHSTLDREVPVKLGLADEDDFPHTGSINFADNRVDPSTGTLRLRGIFSNKDKILTPGMFVRVRVQVGAEYKAVLVPERSLGTDQGQKFLYVLNEKNEVTYRPVKTGSLQGTMRVIEKGLAVGERVVVNGLQRIRQGIVVKPKLVDADPAPVPREDNRKIAQN
jgi:membrane fusion protein, multidrug efflux system